MPRTELTVNKERRPQIGIYSGGVGKGAAGQFEFNVSLLRDPTGQKQFSGMNGTHGNVIEWVKQDKRVQIIVKDCLILADDLIKPKHKEGKEPEAACAWLSLAFRDHHGKWIAPAVSEIVADALDKAGYLVAVHHGGIPKEEQTWKP